MISVLHELRSLSAEAARFDARIVCVTEDNDMPAPPRSFMTMRAQSAATSRRRGLQSTRVRGLVITPTALQSARIQWMISRASRGEADVRIEHSPGRSRRSDVVVGTPARLLRGMRDGSLQVGAVQVLVLDEAERLLHSGFVTDIRKLARPLPDTCRSVLLCREAPCATHERLAAVLRSPAALDDEADDVPPWRVIQVDLMDPLEVIGRIFAGPAEHWLEHLH